IAAAVGVVAIVAALVGLVGILQVRNLADAQTEMYEGRVEPLVQLANSRAMIQEMRLQANALPLRPEAELESHVAAITDLETQIIGFLEEYRVNATDDAALDSLLASVRAYVAEVEGPWLEV